MSEETSSPQDDGPDLVRHVGGAVIKGVLIAYVGYLALFNVAFWTGGYEAIVNGSQDVVEVNLEGAYTVWPFVVRADRLDMTIDDDAVQIEIHAEDIAVDVHLSALRHRIVHMEGVRGHEYVFRLRRRRLEKDLDPADIEALAPIPQIERGVIREPDPNPDRDLSNNWNVRFEDVDARFREIWVDGFRFRGQARVTGGMYLRTEDLLRMPRSEIAEVDGAVTVAERTLASVSGRAAVTISELGLRPEDDGHPLSAMTIESALEAAVMEAGLVAPLVLGDAFTVQGGRGTLVANGRIVEGVVDEATHLDLELSDVVLGRGDLSWRSPVDLHVRGERQAIRGRLELGGRLSFGDAFPGVVLSRALLVGWLRGADLRRPIEPHRGTLDVQGGAAAVELERPNAPSAKAGRVSFSVQYELSDDGALAGAQAIAIEDAQLTWGDVTHRRLNTKGRFFARGRATEGGIAVDRMKGDLTMRGRLDGKAWQGKLAIVEGYGTRDEGRIDATLGLSTLAPIAALPPLERQLPDVAEAFIDLDDAEAVLRMQYDRAGYRFIVDELEVDGGVVTGWLTFGDEPLRGAVHVSLPVIGVGVTFADGQSDVTVSPGDDWVARYLKPGIEQPVPARPELTGSAGADVGRPPATN